jgi:hypothetical protein
VPSNLLSASDSFRHQWATFDAASTDELFLVADDGITFLDHFATLPANVVPVDTRPEPHKLVFPLVISGILPPSGPTLPPLTWDDYVASPPKWERFLLTNVVIPDRTLLLHCLRTAQELYLAADGGAADCKGFFWRRRRH